MKYKYRFFLFLTLIGFCGYLLFAVYNDVKKETIKQLNDRQVSHAKQAAKGIESFFNNHLSMLAYLSKTNSIIDLDDRGKELIRLFYSNNSSEINGITRVDARGRITYTFPYDHKSIDADISSQDHVQEIMRTHKPVVSDVFTAVQGFRCVAFHVPVFKGKDYHGTIAILIPFDHISRKYLEDIKIGENGYAWLISRKGVELYCPVPGHIGKTVYETSGNFPSVISMAEEMMKGKEGITTYRYDRIRGTVTDIEEKHAVYLPIPILNTYWSIVVATPEDEVLALMKSFRNSWFLIIGVLILTSILFSYYLIKAWTIVSEEEKRKRAEAALKEAHDILSKSPAVAFLWKNREGWPVEFVTENVESLFGYTAKEFMSGEVVYSKILYPDDLDRVAKEVATINQDKEKKTFTHQPYRILTKDGQVKWVEDRTYIRRDEKDNITHHQGIVEDITARMRAEDALRESEEKYRLIAENMADIISVLDMNLRFTYISPSIMRIRGFTVEEAMEQTIDQVMTPESLKIALTAFEEEINLEASGTADPDRIRIMEVEEYRKDGSSIWLEASLSYLRDKDHKPVAILAVTRDITDRKHAEDQRREMEERLQRAEKMEALGTLAGGVAHDLNNVLGVVVGYAELLLGRVDESSSIRPNLVNIMHGGQRAAAIVQDLLTLARRGVSGREVLNVNRIIADCQQLPEFEKLSTYHSAVLIKTDLDPDLLNISGSSAHLGKTLFNLVSNATEAMPKGGILTIKTANQYLDKPIQGYDKVREGDYVVLSVSDTGEGIPAVDLKHIFEPFYTKKVMGRSGTGLGLAVVWGTVKDHHGYINVESEEGKGSTFTLYFPVTREEISAERIAVAISEYMGKGESILIVDDVKEQRDLAAEMLRELNYNVSIVSSGEEAIAYLKEHQADLMVLDMIMDPGIDGLDTYKKVLEIHPKQKAIIVSGFSETYRVHVAQTIGAGAYVRKPYLIEKLGLAVRTELDRK